MNIEHLWRSYGENQPPVLADFSLELPESGVLCLFGPSGCGKTTLLFALCEALWKQGKRTAFLFQEDRLLPWLSAQENVETAGAPPKEAKALLQELGLSGAEGKRPGALSGGMRRRTALARALAYGGDVLFLDEPFKGLDEQTRAQAMAVVQARRPRLTVLVTHDKTEAEALSDRILFLSGPPLRIERQEARHGGAD